MMKMEEINMEINIGDEPFRIKVPFDNQDMARDVEAEANRLLNNWRKAFPKRTEKGLLAMMVYQYASHYKQLTASYDEASRIGEEILKELKDIANSEKE